MIETFRHGYKATSWSLEGKQCSLMLVLVARSATGAARLALMRNLKDVERCEHWKRFTCCNCTCFRSLRGRGSSEVIVRVSHVLSSSSWLAEVGSGDGPLCCYRHFLWAAEWQGVGGQSFMIRHRYTKQCLHRCHAVSFSDGFYTTEYTGNNDRESLIYIIPSHNPLSQYHQ